jgi:excisionase family DNA binding protein
VSEGFVIQFSPELVKAIALRVAEVFDGRAKLATDEAEPYLSVEQAAECVGGRSKHRIDDLAAQGKLRCVRDGRAVLTKRLWIDEYLASQVGVA